MLLVDGINIEKEVETPYNIIATYPSFQILTMLDKNDEKHIERCGRTCYKSEHKITDNSSDKFINMIKKNGHESVFEHVSLSVRFIASRVFSHQLIRHRHTSLSPSQESQRYVNYNNQFIFIIPYWLDCEKPEVQQLIDKWIDNTINEVELYCNTYNIYKKPEVCRYALGQSVKTDFVVTANIREWRDILSKRTSLAADMSMRQLMVPLLVELKQMSPILFDDIEVDENEQERFTKLYRDSKSKCRYIEKE